MNFFSNVLDAIPVVGHVKGVIHYAAGDVEGGNRAIYQSTRTTAVVGAGVVGGALGGPAGAIGGAVYAGSLSDCAATALTNKPQGIVKHCKNVNDDITHGRNPTTSLVLTGFHVGFDAVGGVGMGGLSSATAKSVGKKIASNVGEGIIEKSVKITAEEAAKFTVRKASETVVKKSVEKAVIQAASATAHVAERAILETIEQDRQTERDANRKKQEQAKQDADRKKQEQAKKDSDQTKGAREATTRKENNKKADKDTSQSGINTGTGSGSQPPEENKDSKKTDGCNTPGQFSVILKLLKEIIESICREENREKFYNEFLGLKRGQRGTLTTLFKKLNYFGTTEVVLKSVIQIFDLYFPSDFTFKNFLSLMEFVKSYINNNIEERSMISLGTDATPLKDPFSQLKTYLITLVTKDFDFLGKIIDTFIKIRAEIQSEIARSSIDPNFRDLFSAVYHYLKHSIVPGDGIFSIREYYNWIRFLLKKIEDLTQYSDLCNSENPRTQITYELYVPRFCRRIRIVIKIQGKKKVLSTCYVVDKPSDDSDKEGDVFIDEKWYMNLGVFEEDI